MHKTLLKRYQIDYSGKTYDKLQYNAYLLSRKFYGISLSLFWKMKNFFSVHEKVYILWKNVLKQMMFQINGNIYGINTDEKKGKASSYDS